MLKQTWNSGLSYSNFGTKNLRPRGEAQVERMERSSAYGIGKALLKAETSARSAS